MPNLTPHYHLNDFVGACGVRRAVYVPQRVIDTARDDLNLRSVVRILSFISTGGIERPELASSGPYRINPELTVDAYNFYSGMDYAYLAFFFQPATNQWVLKSLKRNTNSSPRAFVLAAAMQKVGLLK